MIVSALSCMPQSRRQNGTQGVSNETKAHRGRLRLYGARQAARAQVPANIAERVRAAGQAMDPTIGQLYAPMFPKEAWAGVSIQRDIAYGSDALQRLDVFTPDGAKGKKLPVLLFVHGGGFTRGDKHGDFYPDNITLWAAKNGMVGVNIDYRLAPKDPWPAGVKDLASRSPGPRPISRDTAAIPTASYCSAIRPAPTTLPTTPPIPRCAARRRPRSKA